MTLCVYLTSYSYDFKDGECYYTITSLSDLTVALTNSGEIASTDRWETTYVACYSGDFTVPRTAEYSGKTFTVASIESNAFQNCNIENLTIPTSITTANIKGTIKNLIIEDGGNPLSELETSNVKKAYIGRNIDVPWNHLIYSFSYSNIEQVEFGNLVTYVPGGMFEDCHELKEVKLSNSVKEILNKAFSGCSKLQYISGENVELIETAAFNDCVSLESFDFPNLNTIDDGDSQWGTFRWGAFQGCTKLKSIVFPEGLTKIGTMAFMDCTALESINIPGTITTFGYGYEDYGYVFSNCSQLKNISIAAKNPIYLPESTFDSQTYINAKLNVPVGSLDAYRKATVWDNFFNIEEDATLVTSVCMISVHNNDCEYGTIEFLDKTVDSYSTVVAKIPVGESLTLKFNPYRGYSLRKVLVNDVDFTSKVSENILNITNVNENLAIEVEFEEEPIYLSIKQAEGGSTMLKVYKWNDYKFIFTPEPNWEIHTISFNGIDVTNQLGEDNSYITPEIEFNSELIVTYINSSNSIPNISNETNNVRVIGSNGKIIITNASDGESINIYSISGILLYSVISNNGQTSIDVIDNQVYIVKIGNRSYKIAL